MKEYTLKISEDELKAMIAFHGEAIYSSQDANGEHAERAHTLTKKLNRKEPELTEIKSNNSAAGWGNPNG